MACKESTWNNPYPTKDAAANILYTSFEARPKHLDPAQSYSSNEIAFTGQIYEPPLQYHFLKRPYEIIPLIAAEVPKAVYYNKAGEVLPDHAPVKDIAYTIYEIKIKQGVKYQPHPAFARDKSGEPLYLNLSPEEIATKFKLSDFTETGTRELVANDFVYEIKRLAHPRLHSPIYGLMTEYIDGLQKFGDELRRADAKLKRKEGEDAFLNLNKYDIDGVKVIDRYTYSVKIKGKYPQFLYWLAMPFFAPIPPEADQFYSQAGMDKKNITLDWYPVGTGPYMLTENNPNLQMVMERNPNFHGETYPGEGEPGDKEAGFLEDAGKPVPFIDKVVHSLEKEDIPSWNKFLQGYYDASGITSDSFDQAINFNNQGEAGLSDAMKEKGINLITAIGTSTFYMGFNMQDPVVGGDSEPARKLRQAIAIAVDYEERISIFLNGRGIPAQGPIPPGIFGYRDGKEGINPYVYDWVNGKPRRKSIEEARKLLTEAGYPNGRDAKSGKPLILYFDTPATGPDAKASLDWLRKQFNKLNIQLVIRGTDYNRFQDKMLKGTAQIFEWGWNADYPDPENFLFLLYGPNAKMEKNGENAANYSNKEFDALFEKMKNMANGPERQKIIDQMMEIARRDSPWLWGLHPQNFALYHQWYFNSKPNLMANNTMKYKRIDPELRAKLREEWNQPNLMPVYALGGVLVAGLLPAMFSYRRKNRAKGVAA
ncbi:MAG: ABC transporter substrate-binding protein [Gammaproteobacteria bacterium]|nr:ABC transporter substrate-binding protein [Gammaproteobacteria bacterium]